MLRRRVARGVQPHRGSVRTQTRRVRVLVKIFGFPVERAMLDVRSGTSAILVVGVCDEADIGVTLRRVES